MNKPYSIKFRTSSKILAIIYICYQYNFPISLLLSFYEMYGNNSLLIFKALACSGKIFLTDNKFAEILDQSRILQKEIVRGIQVLKRREEEPEIEYPQINTTLFNVEYATFINEYLLKNIVDIYAPAIELKLDSTDLYNGLK